MIDASENENVQYQEKYANGYGDCEGCGVALIISGGQLSKNIVRRWAQLRMLESSRGSRHGGGDRSVRRTLGGRYRARDRGWLGG